MSLPRTSRPACPFVAGPRIDDPCCFVGRKEELKFLADRMKGIQPISVNVVGERLSGKSSLLWHFTNTWAQMGPDPSRFLVVFICLRLAKPKTEAEFYRTLADALSKLRAVEQCKPLRSTLAHFAKSRKEFGEVLNSLAEHGLLPVFCLDDFEKLFDHKDELNKDFYDRLRGLMSTNKMMLIIATRKPLEICGAEQQLQSAFFNMAQLCELREFSEDEPEELLCLPVSGPPALDLEERQIAKSWGGKTPWQLQLAASFLFEARQSGKSTTWAKQQFERERGRLLQVPEQQPSWSVKPWLRAAFVDFPRWLGRLPLRLGRYVDDTANLIMGWIIILLILACLFKYAGIADLFAVIWAHVKPS